MKIPGRLLIFLIALYRTTLILASVKHRGKLHGESCVDFRDCGENFQAFLLCENYMCQCARFQYYQAEDKMCVSYVDQKCDATEPTDKLPTVLCGKNSECIQLRHERFGRCRCLPGYVKNFEQKCVASRSQINNIIPFDKSSQPKPFPTGNQNRVGEPAQRNHDNYNGDEIPSFPYPSANTRSGVTSLHSSLKHYINSNTILSCLTIFSITRYILFL